ncbi:MAG: cell division protein FtsA [Candidatus Wildermuthbacteria bacterium RIFCSPHIGHO2_01_FULL_45_20]|uniref:Cell division protein FtsA n=1 Tax=Candidatus Wildermuthbacteria bacterium RIFCSPHIGHO2_02_FULL_45_25 TaxID=1802450 RepID=A0A1G2R219_9BACT|nr:MAG: cell division protein FtsA [Candidatus Wildermuthbacteria bacterium RIFCSPHIGHO2_01_FULL_45_20]OHA66915.1 MAG: cell division protein FtsA [Candidatus Wildermuthbacteria bacterium RIFCSPHIGHO2_02_FULL_45_25]
MNPQIIAGIDIGTHSIKMVVAHLREEGGELEVLGFGEESSSGVRKGAIVRPEEVSERIISLRNRLENITGQRMEGVFVNVGGTHIFTITSHGIVAVSRADGHISQEDVDRVLQAAQAFSLPSNKEILHVVPQQFLVDGEGNLKDVVGMKGVRLEADVLAVCGFSPYVKNVTEAVLGADLAVDDITPGSLMASSAVLTPQQKELGCAVLDLGAGTTSIAVYEEGELIHTAVFPVGSENITNDIAIGLRTEPHIAERVKIEYGSCQSAAKGKKMEKIEIPDDDPLVFSRKILNHIIEARVKEIFQLVNKELKQIGKQGMLPGGIVLIGGGAKLPKIVDVARKDLKLTVKIGTARGIVSPQQDPAYLGVMGLLIDGANDWQPRKNAMFRIGWLSKIKRILRSFIP